MRALREGGWTRAVAGAAAVSATTDRSTTWPPPADEPSTDREPPPRRPVAAGVVLVTVGGLWLLHVLGVTIAWAVLLPVAVIAIGLAVLLGGRSPVTAGLVPLGIVLAVLAGLVTLLPGTTSLEAGDRDLVVTDLADLEDRYELGAGQLTLDLRELDLPPGTTTPLELRVGLGELRVRVPDDVTVTVDGRVTAGELVAFDTRVDGVGPRRQLTADGAPGAGTLAIEASVGLGTLEVSR
jgi:hypothetical protein